MQPALADCCPCRWAGRAVGAAADSRRSLLALIITNLLSMVFGELVPKNIAIAAPMATAKTVVGPTRVSTTLFRPLIWVLNGTANGVLRMFGIEPQEELRSARSAEELARW